MSIWFIDESTFVISQTVWRVLVRKGEKARRKGFETRHKGISVTWFYWIDWAFHYRTSDTKKQNDFLQFLYQIRHKCKKKRLVLVVDNASIHKAKKVKQYCKEHHIKLVYLPPYSPEFNKIEFLRKRLKNMFRRIQRKYDDTKKTIKKSSQTIKNEFRWVDIFKLINVLDS